jgi:hypothetical protein
MPPDFLLRCVVCGAEAVWDTEALPPVGAPDIGHPVLWRCDVCGGEQRHIVQELFVITDKLHHEICVATEMDRLTVDRVMAEMYRYRQRMREIQPTGESDPAEEVEEIANVTGVPQELVAEISVAEAAWMLQRGYFPGIVKES